MISTAGDATLCVADPSATSTGKLVNGAFALARRCRPGRRTARSRRSAPARRRPATYTGPVSNDAVPIEFKQSIGANEALRTGTYAKTLTLTLSTTAP